MKAFWYIYFWIIKKFRQRYFSNRIRGGMHSCMQNPCIASSSASQVKFVSKFKKKNIRVKSKISWNLVVLVRVPILMLKNHPEIPHSRNIRLHKHVSWHLIGLRFCLQIQRHLPWARYICKDTGLESIPGQTKCKNFIDIFSQLSPILRSFKRNWDVNHLH